MQTVNYSQARQNLADLMDAVNDDRAPVLVTRQNGRSVVMVAQAEWDGLMETLHQYSPPANADRLRKSIAQLDTGETVEWTPPS